MSDSLDNLLLHPSTKLQLQYIIKKPSHGLLISAPAGNGKKILSKTLAAALLELPSVQKLDSYPYYFHISRLKGKSDISIEQIRVALEALKLKTPGTNKIRRIIFIENAHYLSIPAQNALLKILEEPSQDTVFLLSITSTQQILPTIVSRMQTVDVQKISLVKTLEYWQDSEYTKEQIQSAWMLSGGSVGLLHALLNESSEHPLKMAVDDAKLFLRSSAYDRLLQIDKLSKNKESLQIFFNALSRTLNVLHHHAIKADKPTQASNLLAARQNLNDASRGLQANANARITTLKLVLELKI